MSSCTLLYDNYLKAINSVFESCRYSMMLTDAENRIVSVNPAFTAISGYALNEILGKDPNILSSGIQDIEFYKKMWIEIYEKDSWSGVVVNKDKNGVNYNKDLSINIIRNEVGDKLFHIALSLDVTTKISNDKLMLRQATFDDLTNLPNRFLFLDRLDQEIKIARRLGNSVTVMFIDLDHFKEINDKFGHSTGDQLLIEVGLRLNQSVREADTVARLGGDEFAVILSQIQDPIFSNNIAETILEKLACPFFINTNELSITASLGVSVYPYDGADVETLLINSDKAMYISKALGRNRFTRIS